MVQNLLSRYRTEEASRMSERGYQNMNLEALRQELRGVRKDQKEAIKAMDGKRGLTKEFFLTGT